MGLAPAEHPSPDRGFIVFFAADSTELDPAAIQVLQQVADTAHQVASRRLNLQAEASGDSSKAAFLAQARIQVVQKQLAADGVASDRIDVSPKPRQPDQVGVIARRVMIQFEP